MRYLKHVANRISQGRKVFESDVTHTRRYDGAGRFPAGLRCLLYEDIDLVSQPM